MKFILKLVTLIALLAISRKACTQIAVGEKLLSDDAVPIEATKVQKFKNATLVYVYRSQDSLPDLEKVFKESWTFSKYKLVSYKEFKSTTFDSTYSFFTIQPEHIITEHNKSHYTEFNYVFVYLHLYMNTTDKKGRIVKDPVARIELYPDISIVNKVRGSRSLFIKIKNTNRDPKVVKGEELVLNAIYSNAHIFNLHPAYLRSYLKSVNDALESNKATSMYEDKVDAVDIAHLKTHTLYIPDYVLTNYEMDVEDGFGKHDEKELMKSYANKYEIIKEKDLQEKILRSEEPVYYLLFTKSPKEKFISVFNSKTGELIYSSSQSKTNHLRPTDFKKIQEAVDLK